MARKRTHKPKLPQGWKAKEYTKLKSDIANYNKRIRRARLKGSGDYIELLPETTTLSEMLALGSKKEIKRVQKELKLYNAKSLKPEMINGLVVPAFQAQRIRENIQRENERRSQIKSALNQREKEGRFIGQSDVDTKPIMPGELTINQLKEYAKLDYTPVVDQRAVKFQENYLNALNEMQFTIAQSGVTDEEYNEVVDLLNQIREIVERQTPEQFYIAQITVPNAAMQVVSGRVLLAHTIALVLRSWEIFDKQH